jgi:hypothetical protein
MTTPTDAANQLLMGHGIKSIGWKDNPIGYTVLGTIIDTPQVKQMTQYESTELAFWKSGDPMMEIICTLQTELRDPTNPHDDGKRRLHIPPRMQPVVAAAVRKTGAPGLMTGGRIAVQRTGGTGATGSPFEFAAEYQPPAVDPGSMLGNGAQAQLAATPAQPAPAAAAPPATIQGSLLSGTPAVDDTPPPGVDPAKWAVLPDHQKAAVRAAMAPAGTSPAASTIPF